MSYLTYNPPAWQSDWKERNRVVPVIRPPVNPNPKKGHFRDRTKLAHGWKVVPRNDVPEDVYRAFQNSMWDDNEVGKFLNYPGRVEATQVRDFDGRVWNIPKELVGEFYIEDLWIPVKRTLTLLLAKGVNPHLGDDEDEYMEACIGDLEGKEIYDYDKLVDMFKMLNPSSDYDDDSHAKVLVLIGERDTVDQNYDVDMIDGMEKFLMYEGACSDDPHPAVRKLLEMSGELSQPADVFDTSEPIKQRDIGWLT